ncbi:MAG TPA: ATP-binding cassette domain-containing protein, partial [Hyphomicrobiaceae bacterium]|nr:ATP-binding cassette domain-containing protein [Hyphomicrobiaceae bacterium]
LRSFAERYPHQLSGGQRKRVALAQVLARQPKILLMDEPFGPLDAQTRVIMGDLLLGLWQQDRKALLFVTHDLDEAIALSDRVVVMSSGPAARLIGDFAIDLARPRHIADIRAEPRFHALHRQIWSLLKVEVQKAYEQGEGKDA